MMNAKYSIPMVSVSLAILAGALPAFAEDSIRLRRGLVVPVRFENELSIERNRPGDRFSAEVENPRDVPLGSKFVGRVIAVEPERDGKAAHMDLEFDEIVLPDGSRQRIQAVPIRMDDKSIRKGGDGRFTAKKKLEDTGKHVLGGMVGGYLIGRILGDKHGEGIILGALAGILVAEGERNTSKDGIVIRRGASMGALFERDAAFTWEDRRDYLDRFRTEPRPNAANRPDEDLYDRLREGTYRPGERRDAELRNGLVLAYEGKELTFNDEAAPYRDGEVWMVPLERTATQIGLKVDGDAQSRRIYVEDDDTVVVFEQGSSEYRLNGKKAKLPKSVTIKGEMIYVPIDALTTARKGRMTVNGTKV
ncbi:MAG TPA: copper amine oxidase N-terminal domain-containing protein [Fimbriimonadaceae bacterium]|nr:copper amine oxidase N-terminal domain-containing protein [Fimbriimonadaceae bacterium]